MRKGRAGFVLLLDHRDEVIELDRAEVLATAGANRHATGLLFLLAHDENVRNLLQAQFADFIVNLFAAQIRLHADAGSVKLGGDFVGVVLLGVRDAGDRALDRGEPGREGAGVFFDQHADPAKSDRGSP